MKYFRCRAGIWDLCIRVSVPVCVYLCVSVCVCVCVCVAADDHAFSLTVGSA